MAKQVSQGGTAELNKRQRSAVAELSRDALEDEREAIVNERAALEAEKRAMEGVHVFQSSVVRINVGGVVHQTALSTLRKCPDSMLCAMFSGRHQLEKLEDGAYFIDRDGDLFGYLLAYLRSGAVSAPTQPDRKELLVVEAEYFGLNDLARYLRGHLYDFEGAMIEADRELRGAEDRIRDSFRTGHTVANLHEGLVNVFDAGVAETLIREPASGYPLLLTQTAERHAIKVGTAATVSTFAEFQRRLHAYFPAIIESIESVASTATCGWLIAGGCVLRALLSNDFADATPQPMDEYGSTQTQRDPAEFPFSDTDVDVFIWARAASEAQLGASLDTSATALAKRIYNKLAALGCRTVRRTGHVITVNLPQDWLRGNAWKNSHAPVQIILRLYASPSEVLHGFDHDACCLGYDGKRVWALPRALRALRHGYTVVNPLHAWPNQPSYELRCVKYSYRGFAVAVPGLQLGSVDWPAVARVPLRELRGINRLLLLEISVLKVAMKVASRSARCDGWRGKGGSTLSRVLRIMFHQEEASLSMDMGGELFTVHAIDEVDLDSVLSHYDLWLEGEDEPADQPPNDPHRLAVTGETWSEILDAGRDDMRIPRKLEWSRSPRTREYLNATNPGQPQLDYDYFSCAIMR